MNQTEASPVVEIRDLRFSYPDGVVALDGIDLRIDEGERVGMVGANGAGKSTLLLHLNGVLRGDGLVRIFGLELNSTTVKAIRRHVGLVFQNPDDQLFCPTVFDDVAFGPRNLRMPEDEVRARVRRALEAVGLDGGLDDRSAYHLSLGQKKRVAIATVLAMEAHLLVLDEPTSNLDPRGRREIAQLLENLPGAHILATHDLGLVQRLCTRAVVLDRGKIVADGPPADILQDEILLREHGL